MIYIVIILIGIMFGIVRIVKYNGLNTKDIDGDMDNEIEKTEDGRKTKIDFKKIFISPKTFWNKYWANGNFIPVIIGMALIHLSLMYIFSDWYEKAIKNHLFWFFQVVAVIGFSMLPKSKNPIKHKLGKVVIILSVICIILIILEINGKQTGKDSPPKNNITKPSPSSKILPINEETKKKVVEMVKNSDLSDRDKDLLICHAEKESNFNQIGPDGKPYTNHNNDGSFDTGVFQINSRWLDNLPSDHNPETLEGNFKAAIYVLKKQGHKAWKHPDNCPVSDTREFVVTAPVGDWVKFDLSSQSPFKKCSARVKAEVYVRTNVVKDKILIKPDEPAPKLGAAKWLEYSSATEKETEVILTFKY